MKTLPILFFVLLTVSAFSQPTRTLKLTQLEASPDSSAREGYAGVTDTSGRQRYANFPRINLTCLTYTPPATGNEPFYYSTYVTKCGTDSTWYIDWTGRRFFLGYNGPISGGGIYGGSGTVPAGTFAVVTNTFQLTQTPGGNFILDSDGVRVFSEDGLAQSGAYQNAAYMSHEAAGSLTIGATGSFYDDFSVDRYGIQYVEDLSGTFTTNSLVSKKYVDDAIAGGGGGGTVTSVGFSAPTDIFNTSGSPVTTSGTISLTLDNQTANTFWAGPTSGGAAAPAFRAIVGGDIPTNAIDSTHIKTKGVSFNNLGPTAGIVVGQAPVWNATLSKFVATTVLTAATNASADLSGLLTNPTVVAIQNHSVSATAPTNGQVLAYNSGASEYQPTTLSASGSAGGDLTGTYPNPTIAANKVDSTKVANGTLSLDDINQRGASSGQGIVWNGSAWRPTTLSASGSAGGDLTGTYPNPTIGANKVDSTKVANGTLSLDDINQRGASSGQAIVWDGSAWRPTAVPTAASVFEYTTAQTNTLLTVPTNAKFAQITVVGGGGGGGSGRKGATGTVRCGGGGGGAGGLVTMCYPLTGVSTLYVTVGEGGAGGASRTANSSNGLSGVAGGNSEIKANGTTASDVFCVAGGGTQGSGGTNATGNGGAGSTLTDMSSPAGGAASGTGGSGAQGGSSTSRCGGGGGSGGGITSGNVANAGGSGGVGFLGLQSSGVAISLKRESGGGGAGGSASTIGAAINGTNGIRGGGGGGGGASQDGIGNSGAGGNGGDGYVKVVFIH